MSILDDAHCVLLVHAHPDDETLSTGALILELIERTKRVVLATGSRGERGEIVASVRHLVGEGEEQLVAARERELHRALDVLGVSEHHMLGMPPARAAGLPARRYRDSGMRWVAPGLAGPALDVPQDALSLADLDEVVGDLRALIDVVKPGLVISYDDNGGYGHPDHRRIRQAALLAAAQASVVFAEIAQAPGPDVEWLELSARLPTVQRALRSHATQLTVDGDDVVHSGGQREPITTSVGLRRVSA